MTSPRMRESSTSDRRIREGAECFGERSESAERLLEFHPDIKRAFVLAAVDDLAEDEGVIDFRSENPRRRRVLWRALRVRRAPARVPPRHKTSLRLGGSR